MTFEVDGVRKLAADLDKGAWRAIPDVAAVVAKGAHNIKTQMVDEARNSGHYRHFHRSISYDTSRGGLEAEIGPDKNGPQGPLGNILYFGTSRNGPVLNLSGPLDAEAPRFEAAIGAVAGKWLVR